MQALSYTVVLLVSLFALYECNQCNTELDMDFRGIPNSNDLVYEYRQSFQDCCALCDSIQACQAWTFIFDTKVCVIKNGPGIKVPTLGRISGTRSVGVNTFRPVVHPVVTARPYGK